MVTKTQPKTLADLLLVEVAPGWTKGRQLFAAGSVYAQGTVLAKVAGKVQPLDPAGATAAKTAWAIAGARVDATAGDKPGLTIERGAVVAADELVWPAGITDAQKATALADLDARGIVARTPL